MDISGFFTNMSWYAWVINIGVNGTIIGGLIYARRRNRK